MWRTTVASNVSPTEFWRRRIIRVVPLYWVFLSLLIIGALLFPTLLHTTEIKLDDAIKSFLFIPHFHAVQANLIAPILIPGWSLNYEMFFYLIFGLAMFVVSRAVRALLVGLALVGFVAAGQMLEPTDAILSTYTNPNLLTFLSGIVLAILYQTGRLDAPGWGSALLLVGVSIQLSRVFSSSIANVDDFIGISAAAMVAGSLALEETARAAPSLLFLTIGNASYSIYLSHLFFLRLAELTWVRLSLFGSSGIADAIYVVLATTLSVAGGICVYYLIERPILSLRNRGRSRTPVQAT
jgi:exopolysaccharide production protein ExoZ